MKKKTQKTFGGPILQECKLVEITDPAELAALDRRCREAEKRLAAGHSNSKKPKRRKGK